MACEVDERNILPFLDLLDRSLTLSVCAPIPVSMRRKINVLTEGVVIDLDAPIEGEADI